MCSSFKHEHCCFKKYVSNIVSTKLNRWDKGLVYQRSVTKFVYQDLPWETHGFHDLLYFGYIQQRKYHSHRSPKNHICNSQYDDPCLHHLTPRYIDIMKSFFKTFLLHIYFMASQNLDMIHSENSQPSTIKCKSGPNKELATEEDVEWDGDTVEPSPSYKRQGIDFPIVACIHEMYVKQYTCDMYIHKYIYVYRVKVNVCIYR